MILTRRGVIGGGGGLLVALACPALLRAAPRTVEIEMAGRDAGAAVWFEPIGIHVPPGTIIHWVNQDAANAHTATAYDPEIDNRQRRIPEGADPWDSGYMLPGQEFSATLTAPGVYDYYCRPHELAGMAGRIVVGDSPGEPDFPVSGEPPADAALAALPPVARIITDGVVSPD